MATVYLAEDLKHQRQVAIEVLRPELAAAVGAARFLREITTTANLRHPNILPLYDSGEQDGFLFYVMPYVEGESLRARMERETQLPIDVAQAIVTGVITEGELPPELMAVLQPLVQFHRWHETLRSPDESARDDRSDS